MKKLILSATVVLSAFVAFGATTLVGPWQWRWPDATGWALLVAIASLGALAHYSLIKALPPAVQPAFDNKAITHSDEYYGVSGDGEGGEGCLFCKKDFNQRFRLLFVFEFW